MFWPLLGILLAVCAVLCAIGFYKFVYFLSVGYGFAVAGGGIAILVMYLIEPTATPLWVVILQTVLFVAYGARLSGFLLYREIKNAMYRKTLKEATGDGKKIPIFVSVTIWLTVAVLYVMQVSPMLFRAKGGYSDIILPIIGMAISVIGLSLEGLADLQKSKQKKENPKMVATKGLYRMVRCPNYLGEIIFWLGVFIAGITAYANVPGRWIVAVLAFICITYIMFNGAQRLEKRQMKRYGNDPAYNEYANKTPIIIPLIPLYHLAEKEDTTSLDMLAVLKEKHALKQLDVGEWENIKAKGMKFHVQAFEAEGLGHICFMEAKGMMGMMKMDTIVITPKKVDLPLMSFDRVSAGSNRVLIAELYDTVLASTDCKAIEEEKNKSTSLLIKEEKPHWYDNLRLPESAHYKGKKKQGAEINERALGILNAYLALEAKPVKDAEAKNNKSLVYINGLLENGGPATDVFKKQFGDEKTAEFFHKVFFGL